jgi:hypothetical protein
VTPPCPEDLPAPPSSSHAGAWALFGLVLAVVVIDGWLAYTDRPTMSQWIKRKTDGKPWWKVGAAAVIGVTLFHLLFGGPL